MRARLPAMVVVPEGLRGHKAAGPNHTTNALSELHIHGRREHLVPGRRWAMGTSALEGIHVEIRPHGDLTAKKQGAFLRRYVGANIIPARGPPLRTARSGGGEVEVIHEALDSSTTSRYYFTGAMLRRPSIHDGRLRECSSLKEKLRPPRWRFVQCVLNKTQYLTL
jgi:hypothetical protein